jgi:hypothetical protein
MAEEKRFWTLETARALIGEVRERTSRAVGDAESLLRERAREDESSAERAEIEQRIREVVSRWAREMEALGVEVKGPWLVDFEATTAGSGPNKKSATFTATRRDSGGAFPFNEDSNGARDSARAQGVRREKRRRVALEVDGQALANRALDLRIAPVVRV